ncbi:MAG: hypothetical protein R3E90_12635 [Marinicella sp.]|nr:hypothetical protein [Xanthomonadales bacterium]
MSDTLGNDLFIKMMKADFINLNNKFKTGMLMNDEGKRLFIKQVFPKNHPSCADVFFQYAHVVTINGQLKSDPGVILGFDLTNKAVLPILYRNDLLDHSIHIYHNGKLDEAKEEWLLEYWGAWLEELKANDYDLLEEVQLKTA